jgi:hypothetical protein
MNRTTFGRAIFAAVLFAGLAGSRSAERNAPRTSRTPPPSIVSITPAAGPVGSTVRIEGAYFSGVDSGNVVFFGGVRAAVNEAAPGLLTVTVPAGAFYAPISVTVHNRTATSATTFTPTFPSAGVIDGTVFRARVNYPLWGSVCSMAAADLDGDGGIDLVTTSNTGVSAFRNLGRGPGIDSTRFAERTDLPSLTFSDWIQGVSVGDIDGDGRLDVVAVIRSSDSVAVFRNTGGPGVLSFEPKAAFPAGHQPQEAAIGDLDGDGRPDLVVANANGGWGTTVSVLPNASAGDSIAFGEKFDLTTGQSPYSVCLRDLDGDLKPDIIVANKNDGFISVFRNEAAQGNLNAAAFAARADFPLPEGGGAYHVAPCDIDGDGRIDLALAQGGSGATVLSLLRNAGAGGGLAFEPQVVLTAMADSRDVAAADLDGDGRPDLASTSWETNTLTVMRNAGVTGAVTAGSFETPAHLLAGTNPLPVCVADFDCDGKPDIAVGNFGGGNASIFRSVIPPPPDAVDGPDGPAAAMGFTLSPGYPNPFNASVRISFRIPKRGKVSLAVFDSEGRRVRTLDDRDMAAGPHEAAWDGRDAAGKDCPSGVYFARLAVDGAGRTVRMVLLK